LCVVGVVVVVVGVVVVVVVLVAVVVVVHGWMPGKARRTGPDNETDSLKCGPESMWRSGLIQKPSPSFDPSDSEKKAAYLLFAVIGQGGGPRQSSETRGNGPDEATDSLECEPESMWRSGFIQKPCPSFGPSDSERKASDLLSVVIGQGGRFRQSSEVRGTYGIGSPGTSSLHQAERRREGRQESQMIWLRHLIRPPSETQSNNTSDASPRSDTLASLSAKPDFDIDDFVAYWSGPQLIVTGLCLS
jgi:hypothetical protein